MKNTLIITLGLVVVICVAIATFGFRAEAHNIFIGETTGQSKNNSRPEKLFDRLATASSLNDEVPTASFTVSNISDTGPGSLRQAILDANSNGVALDEIVFDGTFSTSKTISLTSGQLLIDSNITITGPGANLLTVSGVGNGTNHIFEVGLFTFTISGVTLSGVNAPALFGGAILNNGTVNLTNSTVTNNIANRGAGIHNLGTLNVSNSNISGNSVTDSGGGVLNFNTLNVINSTISSNTATNFGGGIYNNGSTTVNDSTVSGNTANGGITSGGIDSFAGSLSVTNSTISGNNAPNGNDKGGGIWTGGTTTVTNSTITNNSAPGANSASGVYRFNNQFSVRNSIIAGNVNNSTQPDVISTVNPGGVTSNGFNLIGNRGTVVFGSTGDQAGGNGNPILNPILAPLALNDGTTRTHALLSGSSALDNGDSSGSAADQRGLARPVDLTYVVNGPGDGSDIGAFELRNATSGTGLEGDVASRFSGNGIFQASDIVQLRLFQIGFSLPNAEYNEFQRTDVAPIGTLGDGCIKANDIVQGRLYQIGFSSPRTAGGPQFDAGNCNLSLSENDDKASEATFGGARVVRIENASGSAGNPVTVNIRVDALGDESEYQFRVNFDPAVLSYASTAAGTVNAGTTFCNLLMAGQLDCSVGAFPEMGGGGNPFIGEIAAGANQLLSRITFNVNGMASPNTQTALTLTNISASDDLANNLAISGANGMVTVTGPSSASVEVGGRVLTADGCGIPRAVVSMTDSKGNTRQARTNPFGYFRFTEVGVGQSYVLNVNSKEYVFAPQVVTVNEGISNLTLVATGESSDIKIETAEATVGGGRVVRVENVSGSAGNPVTVNIRVDALGDESEYQFRVNFDPAVLSYASTAAGTVNAGTTFCNLLMAGQLDCSVGAFPDMGGGGNPFIGEIAAGANQLLSRITFNVNGMASPNTQTALTLTSISASDDLANNLAISGVNGMVTVTGPSSASVEVGGRVLTTDGRGIPRAVVSITDSQGSVRQARTNPFGYFRFTQIAVGETYVFNVSSKEYLFAPQVISVSESISDLTFVASGMP